MQHTEPIAVERSLALYRRLLRAYPPAFRDRYGDEMARVFRDAARDAWRQTGLLGLTALWARTLTDMLVTATRERVFGRRRGLTATAWELIVNWVHREIVPVLPAVPFLALFIVLKLNRSWFPTIAPPDRGWAVLIEAALSGLVARVVMKRIYVTQSWTNSIITAGTIAFFFWLFYSKELGLVGLWPRTLPWVALVCSAVANSSRRLSTENWKGIGAVCIAVPALVLLLTSPDAYLSTHVFLLFVAVVNGVAALLTRLEMGAHKRDVDAE